MEKINKQAVEVKVPSVLVGLPFSQGVKVGPFVFVAGQGPTDPKTGEFVHGTIQDQTELVFENIKRVLEAAGTSLDNLVKLTIFLRDFNDYNGMNEIRRKYVGKIPPVGSAVQVAFLMAGIKVEIDAIAVVPEE